MMVALLLVHFSQQAALASDVVAATTNAISTVTWKAGTAGAEDKHASIAFVNGVSIAQNVLQSAGGAATSPLFMVAAKTISSSFFSLIMIDHANNEIDGGYFAQSFHQIATQPPGLEDAAVIAAQPSSPTSTSPQAPRSVPPGPPRPAKALRPSRRPPPSTSGFTTGSPAPPSQSPRLQPRHRPRPPQCSPRPPSAPTP